MSDAPDFAAYTFYQVQVAAGDGVRMAIGFWPTPVLDEKHGPTARQELSEVTKQYRRHADLADQVSSYVGHPIHANFEGALRRSITELLFSWSIRGILLRPVQRDAPGTALLFPPPST